MKINWKSIIKSIFVIVIVIIVFFCLTNANDIKKFYPILITVSLALMAISITVWIYTNTKEFKKKQQNIIQKQWTLSLNKIENAIKDIKKNLKTKEPSFKDRKEKREKIENLIEEMNVFETNLDCQSFSFSSAMSFFVAFLLMLVELLTESQLKIVGIIINLGSAGVVIFWIGIILLLRFGLAMYDIYYENNN